MGRLFGMSDAEWLTDDEQAAWRALTAVMTQLPTLMDRQLREDADLNGFEYYVLAMLSEAPERTIQLKTLAEMSNASASRLSHVVTRLEKRGWLTREPSPDDARASMAVLTDAGWEKIVSSAPGHVAEVRRLVFDSLTDRDVADLERVMSKVREHFGDC